MSGAYVFNIDTAGPSVYLGPASEGQLPSPFVPENNYAYSPSPSTMNFPLPPPSPFQAGFNLGPPAGYQRERRPSWSGAYTVNTNANLLQPPQATKHHRSYSSGSQPSSPIFGGFLPVANAAPSGFYIHPWLNAQSPKGEFAFDLSSPTPSPKRYEGPNQIGIISAAELGQPATHPPRTHLRIVCDLLPKWPIEISIYPVITLENVINTIHQHLHVGITQTDWNGLSSEEQKAVNKAYLKRCRNAGSAEEMFKKQGVKRVDLLCGKIWLRGLALDSRSVDTMKMFVV